MWENTLGRNSPREPSPLSPGSAPIPGTTLLPKTRTWQGIRYAEAEGVREIDIAPNTEVNPKLNEPDRVSPCDQGHLLTNEPYKGISTFWILW